MLYSTLAVAAAFAGLASAQNYTTSGPLNVTASQISLPLRETWCTAQKTSCNVLCSGRAFPNNCDPSVLSYDCVCTNGNTPNISDYDQTLPSFICGQWIANCVDNHPNDLTGITACRSVICGSKNASSVGGTSIGAPGSSASGASAATGSSAATTSGGAAASTTSGSGNTATTTTASVAAVVTTTTTSHAGAATIMAIAKNYGTPVLAAGMMAAFGLAL